jgi:hypothetical protein
VLVNPTNPAATESETRSLRDAARSLGLQMHVLGASNASEIDAAFRTLVEIRAGALVVSADQLFTTRRDQVVALAARHAVPAIYVWREFATIVSNGLPLTRIHHAAFDADLIGIDPDFRIHVSGRLLEIHDGPFLELGLKGIAGTLIEMPRRSEDYPDRERLARRFEQFKRSA